MIHPGLSLRHKIAAGLFAALILPLFSLGLIIFNSSRERAINSARANLIQQASLLVQHAEDWVDSTKGLTHSLASLPEVRDISSRLQDTGLPENRLDGAIGLFRSFTGPMSSISEIFLLHPETGEVMASSNLMYTGKFFNKEPYFLSAKEDFSIYRAHYSKAMDKHIMAMATPVRSTRELTVAVLAVWLDLDVLRSSMALHEHMNVYLVDRSNLFMSDQRSPDRVPVLPVAFSEPATRGLAGQTGSGIFTDPQGNKTISAYTLIEPLGLGLVVEKPIEEVLGDINSEGRAMLYAALAFATLFTAVSIIISRKLTVPINAMNRCAKEIAEGRPGIRLEIHSTDELGQLGESMNLMSESLKRKERERTETITALKALLEHSPEGIALLDPDGIVALSNRAMAKTLPMLAGLNDRGEIVSLAGRPLSSYISITADLEWSSVSTGLEEEVSSHSSGQRDFKVAVKEVHGDDTGLKGFVLIAREVGEDKRTLEMAFNQEKMAAVGQLAAGIAHDFNNLLTIIIGFSELLLDDKQLAPDVRRQIEAINQSGNKASDLIGQIMDFSLKSINEPIDLELKSEVAGFIRIMSRLLPGNVSLSMKAAAGPFNVRVDPTKLQQVLTNLTLNARDAMPEGGNVVIEVSSERLREMHEPYLPGMEPGPWVILSVTDDGEGIAEDILPNVFEPFFTTKEPSKGTGLGLAQVYGIVSQHGGHISVNSSGERTCFSIYLPESYLVSDRNSQKDKKHGKGLRGRGETILVVEDDKVAMNLMMAVLKGNGYNVISAASGTEGLNAYFENPGNVDLVITDMIMPGLNGYEMALRIREADPSAIIITISGYAPGSVTGRGEEELASAGIVKWIPKPFEPERLLSETSSALSSRPSNQGLT